MVEKSVTVPEISLFSAGCSFRKMSFQRKVRRSTKVLCPNLEYRSHTHVEIQTENKLKKN